MANGVYGRSKSTGQDLTSKAAREEDAGCMHSKRGKTVHSRTEKRKRKEKITEIKADRQLCDRMEKKEEGER